MKKRALYSIMVLALVLGMALTLATPAGAATPPFTGDVPTDFTGPGIMTIPDTGGVGDVGLPLNAPPGTVSGWDMVDLRLTYDAAADTLYVGINTFGIAGDADGDGDPGGTSAWLATNLGTDISNLGSTETIAVYFDLNQDGTFDVIAGVSGSTDVTGFTVANFSGNPYNPSSAFGTALPTHTGSYHANPSAADPDFEFTILNFSTLPGQDALLAGFRVWAFMGSLEDDGIGEDFIRYEQSPSTITTIASSATMVVSGDTVDLTVTEANPIASSSVNLTNPSVEVWKNGTLIATLVWPPDSGEAVDLYVLNVGETWSWTIPSGPITATTTFVAIGSGIAPGDFLVTYPGDQNERDDVTVDTFEPNTITTITASETLVMSGDSVALTVTEENTGGDPLTNPYVEVWKNGTLIATLVAPPDSGDNGNNILDPLETWSWTISSGPITTTTTFVALGFGTDSLGHEVSYAEGYLGERDYVTVDTFEPNTITTITASETLVDPGDSVDLTVTEENTGGDPLTNPYVEVWKNGTLIATLVAPPDSGDNGDGILDPLETWRWTISSGAINSTTQFVALGFGTDSLGHEVSYAQGYLGERDDVIVRPPGVGWETYPINKLAVLAPWIALAAVIISGASLLVIKRRRA
ncbi:MAG: hypothetical protein WBE46_06915 [Dehalococcoidia bacterium]